MNKICKNFILKFLMKHKKINDIKPQGKPLILFSGASPGEPSLRARRNQLNHTFSSAEANAKKDSKTFKWL